MELEGFEAFYKECTHPLFYNGDLHTANDIRSITTRFPRLAGIVIGRGLLANPALALEYKQGTPISSDEHIKKVYYGHKGISEHTLEGDEIFNHQYSTGYDLHLYSENNAFTIARSESSVCLQIMLVTITFPKMERKLYLPLPIILVKKFNMSRLPSL